MTHIFSIKEALTYAWQHLKSHSGVLFPAMVVVAAIQIAGMVFDNENPTAIDIVMSVVLGVAGVFVGTGLTRITLGIAEGHHVAFKDLFPNWLIVWKYFVAGLLSGLVVMVPLIVAAGVGLLVVLFTAGPAIFSSAPINMTGTVIAGFVVAGIVALAGLIGAIYLGVRYSMVRYAVLDHHQIVQSLRTSWSMTNGRVWKLTGFLAVLLLVNLLGFVLLVIGLLVTVPLSMIAYAHVYIKLKAHHSH